MKKVRIVFCNCFEYNLKRSEDPGPEGGTQAPSEGSLTLVSNVLGILVNVVLDMIGNLLNLMLLNTQIKYIENNKW